MERGIRVSKDEQAMITLHNATVFVSYQRNGYKDERTELRILEHVYKEATRIPNGPEFLLIQDQLTSHKTSSS
jgi:hypothetical protein